MNFLKQTAWSAMAKSLSKKFSAQTIKVTELQDILDTNPENVLIIDVREDKEQLISVIEHSRAHISPAQDLSQVEDLEDFIGREDRKVVVYCTGGYRSGKAIEMYEGEKENVYNLEGGIISWVNSGGQVVVKGTFDRVDSVHGYSPMWAKFIYADHIVNINVD
eukprot:TRINITY_DN8595_c0_g1_i1.p1 TRINITY_DN8595_c0_g1~~TRINITY_DN8595_c0_g1_i1.p1  ORF type:complete len:182 (-),score=25.81 TRINITY_DN8595_c0_g1_i1:3-491(-)